MKAASEFQKKAEACPDIISTKVVYADKHPDSADKLIGSTLGSADSRNVTVANTSESADSANKHYYPNLLVTVKD